MSPDKGAAAPIKTRIPFSLHFLEHAVKGNVGSLPQKHAELLEAYATREAAAVAYIKAVRPGLAVHTGELRDPKARLVPPIARSAECKGSLTTGASVRQVSPVTFWAFQLKHSPMHLPSISCQEALQGRHDPRGAYQKGLRE